MKFKKPIFFSLIAVLCLSFFAFNVKKDSQWEHLLDKDLSQWDKFLGVPHYTVDIEGYEKSNGIKGTPIGLNKDPLHVFSTIELEGETILKVTGEIYAGLSTKKEYENYHLSMQVKWGEQKYEPRLDKKRDSGILYHAQGPHGAMWNCWMQSQEMQVQEGDMGDYYTIAGSGANIRALHKENPNSKFDIFTYNPNSDYKTFKTGEDGRCRKISDYEKQNQWNRLDLICMGDTAYHVVNGKIVLVLEKSVAYNKDGKPTPLTKGKIQLQSEGAEVYYKDIKIRSVKELPREFAKQLKQ